jgi:iron complex transport system substrate-binding protein
MNRNLLTILTIILIVSVGISGCITDDEAQSKGYTDDTGRTVTIDGTVETVVSLSPANTEILFAIGAGDMVIGDTEFCNYPEEALAIENVGGFSTVNVERIIELDPDVVFGEAGHEEVAEQLGQAGIPVFMTMGVDFETVMQDISIIGEIIGHGEEADALVASLTERTQDVLSQTKDLEQRKSVLYLLWDDPVMSAGPGTFIHEVIEGAGGENMAGDAESSWPIYDMESIVIADPDVIILAPHGGSGISAEELMDDPVWSTINAVKDNNVYEISNADTILRPGPRIVDALEEVYGFMPTTITVTDDTGETFTFDSAAERVISIAPSNTEILFALGAGGKLIGDTEYCNYPEEALAIENVGGFSTVDVERIIELDPDVVFGTSGHEEIREQLSQAGIAVVLFKATDVDKILDNIRTVGEVVGMKSEADALVADMSATIEEVSTAAADIAARKTVFYMIWNDPLMSAGSGTFIDAVISLAGGENIAGESESAWPMFDMETLILADPDVIILAPHGSSGITREQLMGDPTYAALSAVQEGAVFELTDGDTILRAGPRIVTALQEVYGMLYG